MHSITKAPAAPLKSSPKFGPAVFGLPDPTPELTDADREHAFAFHAVEGQRACWLKDAPKPSPSPDGEAREAVKAGRASVRPDVVGDGMVSGLDDVERLAVLSASEKITKGLLTPWDARTEARVNEARRLALRIVLLGRPLATDADLLMDLFADDPSEIDRQAAEAMATDALAAGFVPRDLRQAKPRTNRRRVVNNFSDWDAVRVGGGV